MLLRRLYLIFLRYAEHNLSLDKKPVFLSGGANPDFAEIETIQLSSNRLIVQGWSEAERIRMTLNRTRLWAVPELSQPGRSARGFTLDAPFEVGDLIFQVQAGDDAPTYKVAGFSQGEVKRARARLVLPYLCCLIGLLPVIWRWKRKGDMGARELVKERLGLVPSSLSAEMQAGVLDALISPLPCPYDEVTIVLPVYNAFEVLTVCLQNVAAHTDLDWHLIVIEDRSPDSRVWPMLQDWAVQHATRVTLLRNDTNLGFIGAVNRGLSEATKRDAPVVLLNSDALVPDGWASRLLAPLAQASVASVTPMSNDAEIFTVPVICHRHDLFEGEAEVIDRAASTLHPTNALVDAPTGVGFCMALSPLFLAKIPQLDVIFGKGYGEETDWCQKARALGGQNLCTPNLFVEHRGGESFGSAAKQALLERNGAEISRRYSRYDQEVQDFIRADPLNTARLALGLAWVAGRQDVVSVYLAHAMGGGAEYYLSNRIAQATGAGRAVVVLRVGQGHAWKLELHTEHGMSAGMTNDVSLIKALLLYLPRLRLIYSCGVGGRDAVTLPEVLLDIAKGNGRDHPIEVLFHDFFPISPSYTLLSKAGIYEGVPMSNGSLGEDEVHRYPRPGHDDATLMQWQSAWGALVNAAVRCVTFSENSRRIVLEAYPEAASSLVVEPHSLRNSVPRISALNEGIPVIGVLGNIGYQKGAAFLQRLSREFARTGAARLVVIGQIDPAFPLAARGGHVHGNYELRDLPGLVARYGISGWFIPSIWPETFSFTTHEALATGMPVISFDIGAQGDAVAESIAVGGEGGVIALPRGADVDTAAILAAMNLNI